MKIKIRFIILIIVISLVSACSNIAPEIKETSQVEIKHSEKDEKQALKTGSKTEKLPFNLIEATVTKHVDGDTVYVEIHGKSYKLRMIGINCPEYTKEIEPYGKESSEYTNNQLIGKTVYLETDVSDTDKYGRLLRYIWLEIPNEMSEQEIRTKMFNAQLVLNGYARAGYYPPDIKYTDYLKKLQAESKNNKIGIWGF